MTTTDVHVVLSCTNRKHAGSGAYPRLRDIRGRDLPTRATAWIERIGQERAALAARDLYAGEYWRAGLELAVAAGRDLSTRVWVLSAGLGLISTTDIIPAYGATLASGHPDSVVTSRAGRPARDSRQGWWRALAGWAGPGPAGQPRRVAELAEESSATIVVCAGPDYLSAIAPDLAETWHVAAQRLLVFGSGAPESGLERAWVQVPGRLRLRLGGSMSSTGPRAARAAIEVLGAAGELRADKASHLIRSWLNESPLLPRFNRKRLGDEDLAAWIACDFDEHPSSANKSAALRRLREAGLACEQSRFGRLYDGTIGSCP